MKKINQIITVITGVVVAVIIIQSCAASKITDRGGSQLWAENCTRCHYTPPTTLYTNDQWEVIGTHMQLRAMLTDDEAKKVIEFIKSANQ